jgi:hypothetical protein
VNADQEPDIPSEIEARSKAAFDASVAEVNASVRSRLTQARFAAVAELERKQQSRWQRMLAPATGLAAVAIVAALVVGPLLHRSGPLSGGVAGPTLADEDMPILLDTDNMEMIEDMEFYAWLDDDTLDEDSAQRVAQPGEPARS